MHLATVTVAIGQHMYTACIHSRTVFMWSQHCVFTLIVMYPLKHVFCNICEKYIAMRGMTIIFNNIVCSAIMWCMCSHNIKCKNIIHVCVIGFADC